MERDQFVSCACNHMTDMFTSRDHGTSLMSSTGLKYPEIPSTCDKTWPMSNRFGTQVDPQLCFYKQEHRYELYKDKEKQTGKGSSIYQPLLLRITHRVCCVETLETLLSIMNRFINSSKQKETGAGRSGIVPSPQRTALFFKGHKLITFHLRWNFTEEKKREEEKNM